jgi:hypothetical protein
MPRSALLTFRMHRFEVLITTALALLTTISAAVVFTHVTAANPPDQCWIENWAGMFDGEPPTPDVERTPGCQGLVQAFWPVASEASFVASPIGVLLPFVVGLLLGVPIVGRELELRTASLSWSLTGDRLRWLLARFVPVLGLALVAFVVAALAIAEMARAAHPWNFMGPGRIPDLTELGSEGPTLVGRGIMALGIALLAGAVVGRTLPALAVAAVACFVLLFGGAPLLQAQIAERVGEWRTIDDQRPTLVAGGTGFFGWGYRDESGTVLTPQQAERLMSEQCPECPPGDDTWLFENLTSVNRMAPIESYPVFEAAETAVTTGIGAVAMLLTFPVVSRRRPT